jgi:DNA polymerase-3 subunit beta
MGTCMQLTISKKDFFKGLQRTHAVADRKSSMPILSNILLSAEGPKLLRLAATDLYLAVATNVAADVKQGGTVAVSARTLFEIVGKLPEGTATLTVGDNHSVEIRAGKVRYRLPGMPGQEFPALPSPGETEFVSVEAETIASLVRLTEYSISSDDTRPHLAGALFEGDGKVVRMVTTDGHRLSKAERKQAEDGSMLNFSMLVPNKGIRELRKLAEDVKGERSKGDDGPVLLGVATAGGNAFFRRDDVQLSVKLADEQFPPYAKVIPQSHERRVRVPREALLTALERVSVMANDKSGAVRFSIEPGSMRVASENPDLGESHEELDVDFAGEAIELGFNAKYVRDVLNALVDDEVLLELGGQLDPLVIRPSQAGDFVGVIMPMRI